VVDFCYIIVRKLAKEVAEEVVSVLNLVVLGPQLNEPNVQLVIV
jgi:hypothetical protein